MKEKTKNTFEKWWKSVNSKQIYFFLKVTMILAVICLILGIVKSYHFLEVSLLFLFLAGIVSFAGLVKDTSERIEQKEKETLRKIKEMLGEEKQVEVRINSCNNVFQSMLMDVLENKDMKLYAKFCNESCKLTLTIVLNENYKKDYDNVPYDLFLESFERIE